MPDTFCFIVEFRDPETDQVLAEIGRAETEPTCRELIRHEMACWYIQGYEFLNAECCCTEKVSGPEFRVRKPIPEHPGTASSRWRSATLEYAGAEGTAI